MTKSKDNEQITYFHELAIKITRNVSIKIATIATLVITAMSGTWMLAQVLLHEKDNLLATKKEEIDRIETELKERNKKFSDLEADFFELKKSEKVPSLLYPISGKHITGQYITFRWKYNVNYGNDNFTLELVHLKKTPKGTKVLKTRYLIPDPHLNKMNFKFDDDTEGEFFWRIGTGEKLDTTNDNGGTTKRFIDKSLNRKKAYSVSADKTLWSRYGNFWIHRSVYDKVKSSSEISVGITAPFLSYNNTVDCQGRPNTYDMDLIDYVAENLKSKMGTTIYVAPKIYAWDKLLTAVSKGEVDIAIDSITKSKEREEKYPDMRFTDGYRNNSQRMIFSTVHPNIKNISLPIDQNITENALKKFIKGKTLGVQNNTINLQAAETMQRIFGYKIEHHFNSYIEIIDAVRRGIIDLGLLDSVRLDATGKQDGMGIINFDFYPLLKHLYEAKLGDITGEHYAIAVHTNGTSDELINEINGIINSEDGKHERNTLENTYNHDKNTSFDKASLDCYSISTK